MFPSAKPDSIYDSILDPRPDVSKVEELVAALREPASRSIAGGGEAIAEVALPDGWEEYETDGGDVYYVDPEGESHWALLSLSLTLTLTLPRR